MPRPKRFVIQRLSPSSIATWRRVLDTDSVTEARASFLAHSTAMRGGALRLVDTWKDEILERTAK